MDRERLTITLKQSILEKIDELIDGTHIRNRSHAIEYLLSQTLSPQITQAVVLAGGKGIKMQPFTHEMPTGLLPIAGRPVLEHTLELLRNHEIRNIVLAIGHLGDKIKQHFGNGSKYGVKITYSEETKLLGTAGAIRHAKDLLDEKPFLVIHGDIVVKINLREMIAYHQSQSAPAATIALSTVPETAEFGMVTLQGNKIVQFIEKPKKAQSISHLINTGIYIFSPQIFDYLNQKNPSMLEDIFPHIAKEGRLAGFSFTGPWYDISSPKRYEEALREWKQ